MKKSIKLPALNFSKTGPALIGTAIEYYDIALYGYMAPIMIQIFLPEIEKVNALIAYFMMEVLALISQPLGALYFGKRGDKFGRKHSLYRTIIGTAIATSLISIIPTHAQIGYWAGLLFILLRVLQNFFLGGEYNGGAIYCLEHSQKRKEVMSALYCAFTVSGIVAAAGVVSLISHIGINYWRIAYALSFVNCIIAIFLRRRMSETPEFLNIKSSASIIQNEKSVRTNLLIVLIASTFFGVLYGLPTKVFNSILPLALSVKTSELMIINTFSLIIYMLSLVGMGFVAELIGSKRLMIYACAATITFCFPLIELLSFNSLLTIIICKIVFAVITAAYIAPFHTWAQDLFSANNRYTNISLGSSLGKILSHFLLSISIWIWNFSGSLHSISIIIMICCVFAYLAILKSKQL